MAAWPSGKAEDCKSFTPSSNLGAAFIGYDSLEIFKFIKYLTLITMRAHQL
jgi:hypothetical protein